MSMSEEVLLETPLAAEHVALGAKMVPFAGWNMPVQYADGILAEHKHTRGAVSLFDICHMGEFRVKGQGCDVALDAALARSVADQKTGSCRYNFLLNDKGGVIDDLIVYRISDDEFFLVVNAARRPVDFAELAKRLPQGCTLADESDMTAKLDLQGPLAADILVRLGVSEETLPAYYHFTGVKIDGIDVLLSRTGYTGEFGYELYFHVGKAVEMWRRLLAFDEVKPAGLGARDTLRLEMGYPLYGHEMNEDTTPAEAGFGAMLTLEDNSRNFIGSDALRSGKPSRVLTGLVLEGRRAAREGCAVLCGGIVAGKVTSGAFAPSLERAVAMAYLPSALAGNPESVLEVDTGRVRIPARIEALPFYKNGTARKKIKKT